MDIVVKKIGNFQIHILQSYLVVTVYSILLMLSTIDAQSQEVKVAAVVTPRQIQLNEKATLELKISGNTQMKHIGSPTFNFLPDFLAVPLHSETTPRLVDDKINVTMAWVYELIPQQIGEINLSDIQFSYQGVSYLVNPGKIIVAASDTYWHNTTGGIHKVNAEVSNRKPYINEPILYRFRYLYTTVLPSLESPTPSIPAFPGFRIEELPDEKGTTVKVQGKTYIVQESVRRLYPKNAGQILIQPAKLKLPIKGNPKTLKTKSIPINVQPFPDVGKPTHFTGTIGPYNITAQVDHRKIEVRKALTLSLKIIGTGNINTVTPPKIPAIDGFRVNSQNITHTTNDGTRVYTYVITPITVGLHKIPKIKYAFFNPNTHTYQTTQTTPIPITVLPNPATEIEIESEFPWGILWSLMIVILITAVVLCGYLLFRAKSKTTNESASPDIPTSPAAQALSTLKTINSGETGTNSNAFGETLTRCIYKYLCERQDISYRQLNTAEIKKICTQIGVADTILNELIDILTKCDYYRFAPAPLPVDERNALIARAETIIYHIEDT